MWKSRKRLLELSAPVVLFLLFRVGVSVMCHHRGNAPRVSLRGMTARHKDVLHQCSQYLVSEPQCQLISEWGVGMRDQVIGQCHRNPPTLDTGRYM